MNKKDYKNPTVQIVSIQQENRLLGGSFTTVEAGETGIIFGGGGSSDAHARGFNEWIDELDGGKIGPL